MLDLKNTTALVKFILEQDKQSRSSDSYLYLKVLTAVGEQKGIDIDTLSVPHFLLNLHGAGFPPFESVRRARQKIQQHHPELSSCGAVQEFRAANELEYRSYAVGDV